MNDTLNMVRKAIIRECDLETILMLVKEYGNEQRYVGYDDGYDEGYSDARDYGTALDD